jgi:hypothetical protein
MKKLITSFIFAIAMTFAIASCTPFVYTTSGVYDPYDSYYIETSPYYHHQHYYNDYYYDKHSSYYHRQHNYGDNNHDNYHFNRKK